MNNRLLVLQAAALGEAPIIITHPSRISGKEWKELKREISERALTELSEEHTRSVHALTKTLRYARSHGCIVTKLRRQESFVDTSRPM